MNKATAADNKVTDRPATPTDVAALGDGGGVTSLAGVGVEGGLVPLGGVAPEVGGVAPEVGGVAVVLGVGAELLGEGAGAEVGVAVLPVTLMASFWPLLQWSGKVQMKKFSPVVLSVNLTGGFVKRAIGLEVPHDS